MTIEILNEMPIVFTKDLEFLDRMNNRPPRPGDFVLLPADAVLAMLPQIMMVNDPLKMEDIPQGKRAVKITKRDGTTDTVSRPVKRKKGQKLCKNCGQPGHMAKTCPNRTERNVSRDPDGTLKTVVRGADLGTQTKALTRDEYIKLRTAMNDSNFQSSRYSLVNKLAPREVSWAARSNDYQRYIEGRI